MLLRSHARRQLNMGNENGQEVMDLMRDLVQEIRDHPQEQVFSLSTTGENLIKPFRGGAGENFQKWLKYFKRFAQAHQWTDERKRIVLPVYLRGAADTAYDELTDEDKQTFASMTQKLLEKLQTPKLNDIAAARLGTRKQKDTESVTQFATEIQKLVHEAYSDQLTKVARETLELQYFRNGLKPTIRNLVSIQQPGTFSEALSAACYFESQDHLQSGSASWL